MIFIPSKFAEATVNSEYTFAQDAGKNQSGRIDKFCANNVIGTAAMLTVHVVGNGGTADDSNKILVTTLTKGEHYTCPEVTGIDLADGDSIWVGCDTATAVVIRCNGRRVTE